MLIFRMLYASPFFNESAESSAGFTLEATRFVFDLASFSPVKNCTKVESDEMIKKSGRK